MKNVKMISRYAIVTAMYVVFTVLNPFSYDQVQFRISEILVLLVFYRREYAWSLILGCIIANLFSPLGLIDVFFGTSATILALLGIMYSKRLWIATLYPVVFNGLIVGFQLYQFLGYPFWISAFWVAFGQFVVVSIVGYMLFKQLSKRPTFVKLIEATQNIPME